MRNAEILDAQEDRCYGTGNRGSDLLEEFRRRQDCLAGIRQALKQMEVERAAAAARPRKSEPDEAMTKAAAPRDATSPAAEEAEPNRKVAAVTVRAKAARQKAIEAAESSGVDPPDLDRGP